ncbi:MAG: AAA domain-containing protein [Acidimicrobiia bacterium]|nr:AAA domain-containing protein [Acidimicrobiia bacterium]
MSQAPPADLAELVSKFRQETGYPTEEDEEQKRLRDEWREKLLPENLGSISRIDLSAVTNESLYRNPKYVVPMEHVSPSSRSMKETRSWAFSAEQRHVMVIEEINRGNLPRVLGELLFLLEYRGESIHPLYRPDSLFSLPRNLWFIGTMNTADRSIALVDAALRRRFHFVPFFPDSGAIEGLLGRWLDHEGQPAWIGQLVDAVNGELAKDLDGSHLLLGPSHFMKDYGTTAAKQQDRLRRIWEYNIEPLIEDQFFGDPNRIQHYRFKAVLARHGPATGPESAASADEESVSDTPAGSTSGDTPEDAASDIGTALAAPSL